jgi:UPF0271 protein
MTPMRIDLNSDLGEGFGIWRLGDDEALLEIGPCFRGWNRR